MNIYKAIEYCVSGLPDSGYHSDNPLNTAVKDVKALVAAYNALAPTVQMWANAPEWAEWYEIDADGDSWWRCDGKSRYDKFFDLPLGIDHRLCKWQRPA